jgi:hypothetical protein
MLIIIFIQAALILFLKNRIDRPFKILTLYCFIFISLRYYYIDLKLSSFDVDINGDELILYFIIATISLFSVIAYFEERRYLPSPPNLNIVQSPRVEDIGSYIFLVLGLFSLSTYLIINYLRYGNIFLTDYTIDSWAGIYILKIPIWGILISILHSFYYKKYKLFSLSLITLLIWIATENERSPAFTLLTIFMLFIWVVSKKYKAIIVVPILGGPFLFYALTLKRFYEYTFWEAMAKSTDIFDVNIALELLNWTYGRYYQLESTYLMLNSVSYYREKYFSVTYFLENIIPFLPHDSDRISLTQLVCKFIDVSRWSEGTSCWVFYPALMYFDSGLIGLLFSLISVYLVLHLWIKYSASSNVIVAAAYITFLPKFIFIFNSTLASFFELFYNYAYIVFVLKASIFYCRKNSIRQLPVNG